MITQNAERPKGWPLGLKAMDMRVCVGEELQASRTRRASFHNPSTSVSSLSSSGLDTESTASFFQDNSVSLGRLIGFKRGGKEAFYVPVEDHERISISFIDSDVHGDHPLDNSQGICIPSLFCIMVKKKASKSNFKS